MGKLTDNDFKALVQSCIKDYLESVFIGDINAEIRVGYPDFTDKTPLSHIIITVSCESSNFSPSGYDDIVASERVDDVHTETRCHIVNCVIGIDVWSSRGNSTNPSKAGGLTGAQKYFSSVARAFTIDESNLYSMYPDADIESFVDQYTTSPESFDKADLFQCHGELRLGFPIEATTA